MIPQVLLLSSLLIANGFTQNLLVSVPRTDLPPEMIVAGFERNLHVFPQDFGIKKNPALLAPIIGAKSAVAVDVTSGAVLFQRAAFQPLQIASITKLMGVLVILKQKSLEDLITVSDVAAAKPGSKIWLVGGQQWSVKSLVEAALIESANDAMYAIAESDPGGADHFVERMNEEAMALGLVSTHFSNPIGYDDKANYSTTYELSILSRKLLENPVVREIAKLSETDITSDGGKIITLKNTNELLKSEQFQFYGLKTGTTERAGQALVAFGKSTSGHDILIVLLDSPDRFMEAKIISDWVSRAYTWN